MALVDWITRARQALAAITFEWNEEGPGRAGIRVVGAFYIGRRIETG